MKRTILSITFRLTFLAVFIQLSSVQLFAQLSDGGFPIQINNDLPHQTIEISWNDNSFKQQNEVPSRVPLVGVTQVLDINMVSHGYWIMDEKAGAKIWILDLSIAHAQEVALYFSRFQPGKEGKLFVISTVSKRVWGAFTEVNVSNDKPFAIGMLPAERLTLQFETPLYATDYDLQLSEVGLVKTVEATKGFGTSGACEVNVNCSEGANWQRQKRGVARIVVKQGNGLYYCTGSLINNAKNDSSPFFLTANHCGESASETDYAQWIFAFNYESPECAKPASDPVAQTMTGAFMRARAITGPENGSDFKLLQLLQNVPETYNPYFNGWSRKNVSSASGVGIHHPDGDIKKISTYNTTTISSDYGFSGSNPQGKYWRVGWAKTANGQGVTEGGSSGSPLFDANGLIVGMLTGGNSSCNNTAGLDFYGKLSYGWSSNGSEAFNQLAPWLDPNNSGIETLGGLGSDTLFVQADFLSNRNEVSINQFVEFENTSAGKIKSYEWFFEGGKPTNSSEKEPGPVLYESFGDFDVRLVVANETVSDTLNRKDYISVKPFLFPNPAPGSFDLSFGTDITENVEVSIMNAQGQPVPFQFQIMASRIHIALEQPTNGIYVIKIIDRMVEKNLKFIILR